MAKRICPNGEKELITLGTLQDLRIDMNIEKEDIYGGDGLFPIDDLVTSKSITITATDAKFDLNAVALMMGSSVTSGVGNAWVLNEKQMVQLNNTIVLKKPLSDLVLPYELPPEESISLRLEKNNKLIPREYYDVETVGGVTTITINHPSVKVGDIVIASYQFKVENMSVADLIKDEVPFPVHVIHHGSYQQKDGTIQAIETELFACQARGTFSINAQRATASSSTIELVVLDPERPDGKVGVIKRYESGSPLVDCRVDELDWIENSTTKEENIEEVEETQFEEDNFTEEIEELDIFEDDTE